MKSIEWSAPRTRGCSEDPLQVIDHFFVGPAHAGMLLSSQETCQTSAHAMAQAVSDVLLEGWWS